MSIVFHVCGYFRANAGPRRRSGLPFRFPPRWTMVTVVMLSPGGGVRRRRRLTCGDRYGVAVASATRGPGRRWSQVEPVAMSMPKWPASVPPRLYVDSGSGVRCRDCVVAKPSVPAVVFVMQPSRVIGRGGEHRIWLVPPPVQGSRPRR